MFKASPKVAWTCAWLTFHTHTQLVSTGLNWSPNTRETRGTRPWSARLSMPSDTKVPAKATFCTPRGRLRTARRKRVRVFRREEEEEEQRARVPSASKVSERGKDWKKLLLQEKS